MVLLHASAINPGYDELKTAGKQSSVMTMFTSKHCPGKSCSNYLASPTASGKLYERDGCAIALQFFNHYEYTYHVCPVWKFCVLQRYPKTITSTVDGLFRIIEEMCPCK
jgi:hypothetical protein